MEYRCLEDPVALCGSAASEGYICDAASVSGEFGGSSVACDCGGDLMQ